MIGLAGVRPDDLEVGAVADRKQCVRRAQPIVAAARGGGDPHSSRIRATVPARSGVA